MIPNLGGIVKYAPFSAANNFLEGLPFKICAGNQAVEFIHVGLVMLAVVKFQGFS